MFPKMQGFFRNMVASSYLSSRHLNPHDFTVFTEGNIFLFPYEEKEM